jgi:predicted nucleic acid-binding protein
MACFFASSRVNAVNQALKVEESKLRVDSALRSARVARLRRVAAWASSRRDSVFHLAAAYPDQAAAIVTSDSSSASPICTVRE